MANEKYCYRSSALWEKATQVLGSELHKWWSEGTQKGRNQRWLGTLEQTFPASLFFFFASLEWKQYVWLSQHSSWHSGFPQDHLHPTGPFLATQVLPCKHSIISAVFASPYYCPLRTIFPTRFFIFLVAFLWWLWWSRPLFCVYALVCCRINCWAKIYRFKILITNVDCLLTSVSIRCHFPSGKYQLPIITF